VRLSPVFLVVVSYVAADLANLAGGRRARMKRVETRLWSFRLYICSQLSIIRVIVKKLDRGRSHEIRYRVIVHHRNFWLGSTNVERFRPIEVGWKVEGIDRIFQTFI
jgi:hypothetical protein